MNATPPAAPLARRIQHDLALQGISATTLSYRSGIARSTILKWATQAQTPQPAKVTAVADALGIPRAEALRLAGILVEPGGGEALAVLEDATDEALLGEVARRMARETRDKHDTDTPEGTR